MRTALAVNARTAIASLIVVVWVIAVGALADLHDPYSRTAFALGVLAAVPGFVLADHVLEGRRRG